MQTKSLLSMALLAGLASSAAIASHSRHSQMDLLDDIRAETSILEEMIETSAPRRIERRLKKQLRRVDGAINELESEMESSNRRRRRHTRPHRDDGFSGMIVVEDLADVPDSLSSHDDFGLMTSEQDLNRMISALKAEAFSDGRLSALQTMIPNRTFTVAQVKRLVDTFTFGDDKVSAASMLFPQVEDKENWFEVYSVLDFDSDREALRRKTGI